jgi:hypothetical protein
MPATSNRISTIISAEGCSRLLVRNGLGDTNVNPDKEMDSTLKRAFVDKRSQTYCAGPIHWPNASLW